MGVGVGDGSGQGTISSQKQSASIISSVYCINLSILKSASLFVGWAPHHLSASIAYYNCSMSLATLAPAGGPLAFLIHGFLLKNEKFGVHEKLFKILT